MSLEKFLEKSSGIVEELKNKPLNELDSTVFDCGERVMYVDVIRFGPTSRQVIIRLACEDEQRYSFRVEEDAQGSCRWRPLDREMN